LVIAFWCFWWWPKILLDHPPANWKISYVSEKFLWFSRSGCYSDLTLIILCSIYKFISTPKSLKIRKRWHKLVMAQIDQLIAQDTLFSWFSSKFNPKSSCEWGIWVHMCNPSHWKAEVRDSQIQAQPGLCSKTLP
jgi:hypothetical protein